MTQQISRSVLPIFLLLTTVAGCAAGEEPEPGFMDDLLDGSTVPYRDGGVPYFGDAGGPSGEFACGDGMHACGLACVADRMNTPEEGCRLGCGEACTVPAGGTASCTEAGRCTAECAPAHHACGAECVPDGADDPATGCRLGCGDPCPVPDGGEAVCIDGACGMGCAEGYRAEGGRCLCVPKTCGDVGAVCGVIDDGCGAVLNCGGCAGGAPCLDGECACEEDPSAGEPNDVRAQAHYLGRFRDRGDSSDTYHFVASHIGDDDWYIIDVRDNWDFGNPQISLDLQSIPAGHDYELSVWYVCDYGDEDHDCERGRDDYTIGMGCVSDLPGTTNESVRIDTDCTGTIDDHGTMFIRVRPKAWAGGPSCQPYHFCVETE